ncbi:MAG: hypothetical protein ABIQ33_13710, partial [Caldimonas sp.]
MLSTGAPAIRLPRRWRAPLSLGLGVPLLLGSSPAAAAGTGGALIAGSVTTWLGMLAALLALLAPRRPGDVAGAAAVVVVAALFFAVLAWRRQQQRTRSRAGRVAAGAGRPTRSLFDSVPRVASPAAAAVDGAEVLEAARSRF